MSSSLIDANTGSAGTPILESSGLLSINNITVTHDASTPVGQLPTAYLSLNPALGTINLTSSNGAVVYVSEALGIAGTVNLYANNGVIDLTGTGIAALSSTSATIENGGTLIASSGTLVGLLNSGGVSFGTGGGTLDLTSGGSLLNLSGTNAISGYTAGDVIIDGNINFGSVASYIVTNSGGSQTVTFDNASGTSLGSLQFTGTPFPSTGTFNVGTGPIQLVSGPGGSLELNVCFLAGTHIATPDGERRVETLRAGDLVLTLVNETLVAKPITWVGYQHTIIAGEAANERYPVRIRAGAFNDNEPKRDLLVTPEHCVFYQGVLIPVRMLINGGSIIVDRSIRAYTYYHIELETHGILLSENLTTESYLDTGNRRQFTNTAHAEPLVTLVPAKTPKDWTLDAVAPLAVDQATVKPIWQWLRDRAYARGQLCNNRSAELVLDPDLRLVTDSGWEVRPCQVDGQTYSFVIPPGSRTLTLTSRASRPSDTVGPYLDDRRNLGVLVGDITIESGAERLAITAHLTPISLAGWHEMESNSSFRWTNGNAALPVDLTCLNGDFGTLQVEIVHAGPYIVDKRRGGSPAAESNHAGPAIHAA